MTQSTPEPEEALEGELILLRDTYEGSEEHRNLGGRPRLYETPEQFDEAVNAYYQYCVTHPLEPMTITGLTLAMGFSGMTVFYNYANYEGFSQSVERAKTLIMYGYEKKLHGANNAGAKFALSCIDRGAYWRPDQVAGGDQIETHEDRLAHLR